MATKTKAPDKIYFVLESTVTIKEFERDEFVSLDDVRAHLSDYGIELGDEFTLLTYTLESSQVAVADISFKTKGKK